MQNPIVLAAVQQMSFGACCPSQSACCQNTCGQNNQNSSYTQRDDDRGQFQEEFDPGYPRRTRNCRRYQDICSLGNLPHCCGCKCEYYKRMAMIDRDCKRYSRNSRDQRPTPCRTTDHGQFCDRNNIFLPDTAPVPIPPCVARSMNDQNQNCMEPTTYYCGANQAYDPCCGQQKAKCAPFKPKELPKGPISVYRADFLPPKCKGPRYIDQEDNPKSIFNRPPWDWRTRTDTFPYNCCNTLAATEAKLKALDDMLYQCGDDQPYGPKPLPRKSDDNSL